jgi:hypothetical protein
MSYRLRHSPDGRRFDGRVVSKVKLAADATHA